MSNLAMLNLTDCKQDGADYIAGDAIGNEAGAYDTQLLVYWFSTFKKTLGLSYVTI